MQLLHKKHFVDDNICFGIFQVGQKLSAKFDADNKVARVNRQQPTVMYKMCTIKRSRRDDKNLMLTITIMQICTTHWLNSTGLLVHNFAYGYDIIYPLQSA